MKEVLIILAVGAVSLIIAVLMGPVVGMITGWAVGLFFSGWFSEVLAVIGLGPIPLYKNSAEWGWQPQETAPRDGSRILVSWDYTDITIAAYARGKFRDPWTDRPLSGEWQWMKINEVIRQTK